MYNLQPEVSHVGSPPHPRGGGRLDDRLLFFLVGARARPRTAERERVAGEAEEDAGAAAAEADERVVRQRVELTEDGAGEDERAEEERRLVRGHRVRDGRLADGDVEEADLACGRRDRAGILERRLGAGGVRPAPRLHERDERGGERLEEEDAGSE